MALASEQEPVWSSTDHKTRMDTYQGQDGNWYSNGPQGQVTQVNGPNGGPINNPNVPPSPGSNGTTPPVTNPAVVTSDAATKNYYNQLNGFNQIKTGVNNQLANNQRLNTDTSIVDLLKSRGQDSSLNNRANLAVKYGLVHSPQEYLDLAAKGANGNINTQLLGIVKSGSLDQQKPVDNTQNIHDLLGALNGQPTPPATPPTSPFNSGTTPPAGNPTGNLTPNTPMVPTIPEADTSQLPAIQSSLNDTMSQQNALFEQAQTDLQNLRNGTFPLTPAEQTILSTTQQQFKDLKDEQALANKNYQGAITVAGVASGRSRYAPEIEAGNIAQAVNDGIKKIAAIETNAANTMATLQNGFDTKNFQQVHDSYDILNAQLKQKTDTLTAMQTAIQNQIKDTRDYNYKVTTDNIKNMMDDAKFTYQQKKDAIDQAHQQGILDETTRHDIMEEMISKENALKGVYQRDADGTIYDTRTGKVVLDSSQVMPIGATTSDQITNDPILNANHNYTPSGVLYIDGTNLSGAQASKAQLQAAKLGVPYLGKEAALGMTLTSEAKQNVGMLSDYVSKLNPSDAGNAWTFGLSRLGNTIVHGVENWTQIGPGATDVSAYNNFRQGAVKAVQAMAAGGTGLRINGAELDNYMKAIPTYNDTVSVARGKLAILNGLLSTNEKFLVGSRYYDQNNPNSAAKDIQTYYTASPSNAQQIETLKQQYPGLSDSQLLQLVQP